MVRGTCVHREFLNTMTPVRFAFHTPSGHEPDLVVRRDTEVAAAAALPVDRSRRGAARLPSRGAEIRETAPDTVPAVWLDSPEPR